MNNAKTIHLSEIENFGDSFTDILEVDYDPTMGHRAYAFDIAPGYGLRLSGEVLAGVAVAFDVDGMNDSNIELYLYKTAKGRFVCQRIIAKDDDAEVPQIDWQVAENDSTIKAFFGQGWIAQELYLKANIDNTEEVVSGAGEDCGDQYQLITVRRDDKPSLKFFGMSLGSINYRHEYDYDYEETLELFIMPNGQYVCKSVEIGVHEGELNHYYAKACKDYKGIRDFFKNKAGSDEAVVWVSSLKNMHNSKAHIEAITDYNLVN